MIFTFKATRAFEFSFFNSQPRASNLHQANVGKEIKPAVSRTRSQSLRKRKKGEQKKYIYTVYICLANIS